MKSYEHIPFGEVKYIVERLAAENPNYVYDEGKTDLDGDNQCFYVKDGRGSCLWGRALIEAGVEVEDLTQCENEPISSVLAILKISTDFREEEWADASQDAQDKKYTWASAILKANEMVAFYE